MKICLGLCAAALLSVSADAGSAPAQLVFTEQSDTLLTATVGGNPVGVVQNLGPDHWKWGIPVTGFQGVSLDPAGFVFWAEPEGPGAVNHVQVGLFSVQNQLYVGTELNSDVPFVAHGDVAANGAFGNTLTISDGSGTQGFQIAFNDISDSDSVPDGSSTAGLMLISAAALFGLSHSRRLAFIAR